MCLQLTTSDGTVIRNMEAICTFAKILGGVSAADCDAICEVSDNDPAIECEEQCNCCRYANNASFCNVF